MLTCIFELSSVQLLLPRGTFKYSPGVCVCLYIGPAQLEPNSIIAVVFFRQCLQRICILPSFLKERESRSKVHVCFAWLLVSLSFFIVFSYLLFLLACLPFFSSSAMFKLKSDSFALLLLCLTSRNDCFLLLV